MDLKELKAIIKLAQKSGVKRLRLGETEIEFTHEAVQMPQRRMRAESSEKIDMGNTNAEMEAYMNYLYGVELSSKEAN